MISMAIFHMCLIETVVICLKRGFDVIHMI